MFQNSQYTDAHGSTFNDVGRDQIVVNINNAGAMQSYFYAVCCSLIFDHRSLGATTTGS
jgi:hypothetical protein